MIRASDPRNREDWNAIYKIATDRDEVLGALELVHDEYVRSGLSVPSDSGLRVTRYHLLNTTDVLVGIVDGQVVGTMSLVFDSRFGLPLEAIYPEEVRARRRLGKRIGEISCLADRRTDSERTLSMMFNLFALATQIGTARGVNEALIVVHPRHARFYERLFGFARIGEVKHYSAVRGNPAMALSLDLTTLKQRDPKAYKRMYGIPFAPYEIRRRTISLDLLEELSWLYTDSQRPVMSMALQSDSTAALMPSEEVAFA